MFQHYYLIRKKKGKKYTTKKVRVKKMLIIKCVISLVLTGLFINPIFIDSSYLPYRHREKTPEEKAQEFKDYILSFKQTDIQLYCFMDAESDFRAGAFNPKDGDGTPRCGILQFKWETYVSQCVFKYGLQYFEKDVFYNKKSCEANGESISKNQIACTRKMIDNGLIKHWGRATRTLCAKYTNSIINKLSSL